MVVTGRIIALADIQLGQIIHVHAGAKVSTFSINQQYPTGAVVLQIRQQIVQLLPEQAVVGISLALRVQRQAVKAAVFLQGKILPVTHAWPSASRRTGSEAKP